MTKFAIWMGGFKDRGEFVATNGLEFDGVIVKVRRVKPLPRLIFPDAPSRANGPRAVIRRKCCPLRQPSFVIAKT